MIHPTAVINPKAQLAEDVEVGPYCIIGKNVTIGAGSKLKSHVVIEGTTSIGEKNIFFPFAAIGQLTQDLKYTGEPTSLQIGNGNTFRENVTIHRSTSVEDEPTGIGDNNLFLSYAHVAHNCQIGNNCILSNNATLAGHCEVEDWVIISGLSAFHQFCRIGQHAMVGGCSRNIQDAPPFCIIVGNPSEVRGLNLVGLKRRGFNDQQIGNLKNAYKKIFLHKKKNLSEALNEVENSEIANDKNVIQLVAFIRNSKRGIIR